MDFRSKVMALIEWMTTGSANGNLFSAANGVQSQALSLTTYSCNSLQNNSPENAQSSGKTLSIRCVVEAVPTWHTPPGSQFEVERQASIPIHTSFSKITEVVLQTFGYPKETAVTAKGTILIENWKPLKVDKIARDANATVSDMLGQICSFATLKIQILRTSSYAGDAFANMKDKIVNYLIQQNKECIMKSGCPLDLATLKRIFSGNDYSGSTVSEEQIRSFDNWYNNLQRSRSIPYPSQLPPFPYHLGSSPGLNFDRNLNNISPENRMHSTLQNIQSQYPAQKTRMRTSFDPEYEIPKLQEWFAINRHPTRAQIQKYVDELNTMESRRGRKPLDINNVVYWFKNARAALKRTEARNLNSRLPNSMNGYRSNSHSPETAVMSKGSAESVQSCDEADIEDEDNRSEGDVKEDSSDARPSSPVAPLSLTTYKDNSSSRNSPSQVQDTKEELLEKADRTHADSPCIKKSEPASPDDQHESYSDDEDVGDDSSDGDSKNALEVERSFPFSNSSPVSPIARPNPVFVPNSVFSPNFQIFPMGPYISGLSLNSTRNNLHVAQSNTNNHIGGGMDEKRNKRNRTFIDPVTEVPRLEKWFLNNTHPSQSLILEYTQTLNSMSYRQKFPKLEPKNVQFWFKNRRAKSKRMKPSMYESRMNNNFSPQEHYNQLAAALSVETYRMRE